jgi:hypothetical protein
LGELTDGVLKETGDRRVVDAGVTHYDLESVDDWRVVLARDGVKAELGEDI